MDATSRMPGRGRLMERAFSAVPSGLVAYCKSIQPRKLSGLAILESSLRDVDLVVAPALLSPTCYFRLSSFSRAASGFAA